jgi:hypothetical protein
MMVLAPASFAPCTTLRPTPPQPTTSTVEPDSTLAWRMAAPTPVATLQPMMAACVQGRSLRTETTCSAGHTTNSENVPMRAIWLTGSPFSFTRAVPSCMRQRALSSWPLQITERPCAQ